MEQENSPIPDASGGPPWEPNADPVERPAKGSSSLAPRSTDVPETSNVSEPPTCKVETSDQREVHAQLMKTDDGAKRNQVKNPRHPSSNAEDEPGAAEMSRERLEIVRAASRALANFDIDAGRGSEMSERAANAPLNMQPRGLVTDRVVNRVNGTQDRENRTQATHVYNAPFNMQPRGLVTEFDKVFNRDIINGTQDTHVRDNRTQTTHVDTNPTPFERNNLGRCLHGPGRDIHTATHYRRQDFRINETQAADRNFNETNGTQATHADTYNALFNFREIRGTQAAHVGDIRTQAAHVNTNSMPLERNNLGRCLHGHGRDVHMAITQHHQRQGFDENAGRRAEFKPPQTRTEKPVFQINSNWLKKD